jgi:hypothetical protein
MVYVPPCWVNLFSQYKGKLAVCKPLQTDEMSTGIQNPAFPKNGIDKLANNSK